MHNPEDYIQEQPDLVKTLTSLRNCGKKIFLTTNAHMLYMEIVMSATLGDDWMDLFDICIANCKKPLFQRANNPFYDIDPSEEHSKGTEIKTGKQLAECLDCTKTVKEGSAEILT